MLIERKCAIDMHMGFVTCHNNHWSHSGSLKGREMNPKVIHPPTVIHIFCAISAVVNIHVVVYK